MASAKFTWCVPATTKLIEMYEADEALYNARHPDYKNRLRRLQKYTEMAEVISEIRPGCTADDIKKKINGLRLSYSSEKAKRMKSKSGSSAQAVYQPQVYWFHLLRFLDQSTAADESVSNVEVTESGSVRGTPTFDDVFEHEIDVQHSPQAEVEVACSQSQSQPQPQQDTQPPRRKRKSDPTESVLVQATKTLKAVADMTTQPVHEDQYSALGKHFTSELRVMHNMIGEEFTRGTVNELHRVMLARFDLMQATLQRQRQQKQQEPQPGPSGLINAALQRAGITEEDSQ